MGFQQTEIDQDQVLVLPDLKVHGRSMQDDAGMTGNGVVNWGFLGTHTGDVWGCGASGEVLSTSGKSGDFTACWKTWQVTASSDGLVATIHP